MPTSYSDQFFVINPYSPPPAGTAMTFVNLDLVDQNDDADFDRFDNDSVDGSDITSSWPGDTVTINVPGVGDVTYTGVTFYLADGRRVFTPDDGQALQNGTLVSTTWVSSQGPLLVSDLGPTCFTPGTLIKTTRGPRMIEQLAVGDMVVTRDHGPQPLRWIGRQSFDAQGVFAPVLITRGAMGNRADIVVSQQHRILVTGWQAQLYMGADEALVAARALVNGNTIRIVEGGTVDYIHLLFDRHEIITASGLHSESYHPAHAASSGENNALPELLRMFPDLAKHAASQIPAVRQVARCFEASLIAA